MVFFGKHWGPRQVWRSRVGGGPGVGAQTQKQWGLKGQGGGRERWGPEGWGSQHAALFVPSLPSPLHDVCFFLSLCLSHLGSSRGVVAPSRDRGPPKLCIWASQESFCESSSGPQAIQWSPCGQGSGEPLLPKKKQNLVWCPQRGVAASAQTPESVQKSTILILHGNSRAPSSLGGNC